MRNKYAAFLLLLLSATLVAGCTSTSQPPDTPRTTFESEAERHDRELASALRFVGEDQVKGWMPERCMVIRSMHTPGFFDAEGRFPSNTYYSEAILPVLESFEIKDQAGRNRRVVKAVVDANITAVTTRNPQKLPYVIMYFEEDGVLPASAWRQTAWGEEHGNYDVEPEVPGLCSWNRKKGTVIPGKYK